MEDPIKQQVWIDITDTDYAMRYHQKRADKFSKRQEALFAYGYHRHRPRGDNPPS